MPSKKNKVVSVVIPCYNVQNFIAQCLESVINQTVPDLEIICIDNNSSDNTWVLLEEIQRKHPHIIIAKEPKPGANVARNKGLGLATGKWIQFLDADDLLESDKIWHQLKIVSECPADTAFIAAASMKMKLDGKMEINPHIEKNKYTSVFKCQCGNTCSNLWRKDWLIKIGGWNESLKSSQESDLMLRLILAGGNYCADYSPKTIIRDRSTGQISQTNPSDRWKRYIDVHAEFCSNLKQVNRNKYEKYKKFYRNSLLISIITLAGYDLKGGKNYFNKYIRDYKILGNIFSVPNIKLILIKLCGFTGFMKIKLVWDRI